MATVIPKAHRSIAMLIAATCGQSIHSVLGAHLPEQPGVEVRRRVIGCGKASAARRLAARAEGAVEVAYGESAADTDVLHYALDIEVSDLNPAANTCKITGRNTMTVRSTSDSLREFRFRLREQFVITDAYLNGSTPVSITTESVSTRRIELDRDYGADEVFTLTLDYTGPTISAAFGSIEVRTHSGGIPVVATLSEPYYAYTWWPAKDGDLFQPGDNSDKATLDFWITAPDNLTVASNGLRQGVEILSGDRKRTHWKSDYPIAPYLVSFSASEYNTWTAAYEYPGGVMPVEFYIYPSNDRTSRRIAWERVVDMLRAFRPLFGEYPFIDEKYGLYNFPFGGGMEHQTMTGQSGFGEWLTAHELAHQWWGDAVTCKTWNDIWLNEGFASYAEALWQEYQPGGGGLSALKAAMAGMRYTGPGSVYVYDDEVDQLGQIFNGATSYDKGAWVLHMLRHVLGDDEFFEALAAYRAAYEYGAATTEDFQAVCERYFQGGDLDWYFSEWVYGESAPAYEWGWDAVTVNEKNYLLVSVDQVQNEADRRFVMPIDVDADGTNYVIWNDADAEHFVIPVPAPPSQVLFDADDWILWSSRSQHGYVPGPPAIVESSPAPGAMVDAGEGVDRVTITFQTNVIAFMDDVSLVGKNTGPQSFTLAEGAAVNPLTLNLSGPLKSDNYTLTVTSGVEAADSGLALDGEMANSTCTACLPSGDGAPGGNAMIDFTVTPTIPTLSAWALFDLAILTSTAAGVILRRRMRGA